MSELQGTYYAILNTERGRFLTSSGGRSIWPEKYTAKLVREREFFDAGHLAIVEVEI